MFGNMKSGIFALIGVILGYILGRQTNMRYRLGKDLVKKVKKAQEKPKKPYGTPFVVRPDEYRTEQEQKKAQAKKEKGFENVKEFVKGMEK